jgi:heme-degrading monooxygenase HmoA
MILESAVLDVKPSEAEAFEASFREAQGIISAMPGYLSHELLRCIEASDRYLLLVSWETLEDHTIGFRESPDYQRWKALLHHYYDPFPSVEHYDPVAACSSGSG